MCNDDLQSIVKKKKTVCEQRIVFFLSREIKKDQKWVINTKREDMRKRKKNKLKELYLHHIQVFLEYNLMFQIHYLRNN